MENSFRPQSVVVGRKENSFRPQSVVVGRKENISGMGIAGHENQKPGDLKSLKGLGDHKATRNALVPVNQPVGTQSVGTQPSCGIQSVGTQPSCGIQPVGTQPSCGTRGDTLCQGNEIVAKKKATDKLPKQKKGIQPSGINNQAFQPKFTIYCDEESDDVSTNGVDDNVSTDGVDDNVSTNDVDDNMSLVDDENECPVAETCQSVPMPLECQHEDGDELPDDASCSLPCSPLPSFSLPSFSLPSCSFESLEKSVAFSDDSFFSCGQQESESRVVPSEHFREYTWDIMKYLLDVEKKYRPEADYMSRQPEVNTKMRNILVDWMVEVTAEYKLNDETLFLAVDYIDRFLSQMSIARSHFQLLGTASLFISSKYEEIYPPDINEFIFITDDTYTKEQVLKMEALILKVLNLHISTPTISYFLQRFLISFRTSKTVTCLAEYLCHLVLLDGQIFFKFYPSEIALAAVILAAHNFSEEHSIDTEFLSKLLHFSSRSSGLALRELQERICECMQELLHLQTHASSHPQQAIYTKYSSDR